MSLRASILLCAVLLAAPAAAIDGLAPAGPCADEGSSVTGPVAKLFSPQDVASAAGSGLAPLTPGAVPFSGRGACDVSSGCSASDMPVVHPPVNPPGDGEPPRDGDGIDFDREQGPGGDFIRD